MKSSPIDKHGVEHASPVWWGMPWYTVKTYRRENGTAGRLIGVKTFEALDDDDAKLQARNRSDIKASDDFGALFGAKERLICPVEFSRAKGT